MPLSDWLKKGGKSGSDFANAISRDDSTINRPPPEEGKKQPHKPSWGLIEEIAFATRGEVLANDDMDHDPAFYASSETSSDNGASACDPSQLQPQFVDSRSPRQLRRTMEWGCIATYRARSQRARVMIETFTLVGREEPSECLDLNHARKS